VIILDLVTVGLKQEQECKTIVGGQKEEEEILVDTINAGL
jgi:hypothetical protein